MSKHTRSTHFGLAVQHLGGAGRLAATLLTLAIASTAPTSFAQAGSPPSKELLLIYPPLTGAGQTVIASADKPAPTGGFVAAPMPSQGNFVPRITDPNAPAVGPSLFRSNPTYRGDGFTPDSSPAIGQQSKRMTLPGISVKVPLY